MSDATVEWPPAVKDENAPHPIAGAWRPMLRAVVSSFVRGDFGLSAGVSGVEPVGFTTAERIRSNVADYGATLVDLSDDTWQTSVSQWMGAHWDVLLDLSTAEEGRSDLVLEGRIMETDTGPHFTVGLVCVP